MKNKFLILVISLLIASCIPVKVDTNPSATGLQPTSILAETSAPLATASPDECLPPLEDFAFPLGDTNIIPPKEKLQLPSREWKQISRVPGAYENGAFQSIELLLVRSWNMNTEIWARGNKGELLRYDVQMDQWETIDTIDKEGSFPDSNAMILFLDHENRLWTARRWNSQATKLPLFMRYEDNEHYFVEMSTSINKGDVLRVTDIKLDHEGILWMILGDDLQPRGQEFQLYSLDLATLEMKHHSLDGEEILPSLTILPDNSVVVLGRQSIKYRDRSTLLDYYPQTTQVKEIPIAPSVYSYNPESTYGPYLFLDTMNRLWLNDLGWVDLSEWNQGRYQWFEVVRSPVFIGMFIANPSWGWGGPYFTYETPDGRLWYDSPRGAGWVDPEQGKWCVFTSYSSNVLGDSEQNLWILVDGWLYKNSEFSGQ